MLRFDMFSFPEGKKKAVTFSFDDGITQDKRLIHLFDQYGVKGTFNLNSGNMGQNDDIEELPNKTTHNNIKYKEIKEVYHNHEVAIHGYKHINLKSVPSNAQMYELVMDKANLEELIGSPIIGAAYAFGSYNEETLNILQLLKIDYARTVNSIYDFELPDKPLEWNPTCHFNDEKMSELTTRFFNEKNPWRDEPKLLYIWGHSYEMDDFDKWEYMEKLLQELSGREDVWYATNGDIITYMNHFNQLTYSMNGNKIQNNSIQDLWIDISDKIYKIPAGECVEVNMER